MAVACVTFRFVENRVSFVHSDNIQKAKIEELFNEHLNNIGRMIKLTKSPVTFKGASEKFTALSVSTIFSAFREVIEGRNGGKRIEKLMVQEEKKISAEDKDHYFELMAKRFDLNLEDIPPEELQKAKEVMKFEMVKAVSAVDSVENVQKAMVNFEDAKKATGLDIEYIDID